jgi:DEAD/DEAH box helicase domain-containing protein
VPAGFAFVGTFRPASAVGLDARSDRAVELRVDGQVLEVLEPWRAMRNAHPGAVFLHQGESFRITDLDLATGVANAEPIDAREHTRAVVVRAYDVGLPERERGVGCWTVGVGRASVQSQVVAYKLYRNDEVLSVHALDLPEVALDTRGLSLVPRVALREVLGKDFDLLSALHAAEHALIHAMPLLAMCDRTDAGGASMLADRLRAAPLVLVYDAYEGGSGIVDAAYEHLDELVAIAADMLESCDCELGCPRCVFDRDCGSANADLDRRGALAIMDSLTAREPMSR